MNNIEELTNVVVSDGPLNGTHQARLLTTHAGQSIFTKELDAFQDQLAHLKSANEHGISSQGSRIVPWTF